MPTNDSGYRLRATVTHIYEYDRCGTYRTARVCADMDREFLEHGGDLAGCTTNEPVRTVKVEVVR